MGLVVMIRYCGVCIVYCVWNFYVVVLERSGLLCGCRGGLFYGCVFIV